MTVSDKLVRGYHEVDKLTAASPPIMRPPARLTPIDLSNTSTNPLTRHGITHASWTLLGRSRGYRRTLFDSASELRYLGATLAQPSCGFCWMMDANNMAFIISFLLSQNGIATFRLSLFLLSRCPRCMLTLF